MVISEILRGCEVRFAHVRSAIATITLTQMRSETVILPLENVSDALITQTASIVSVALKVSSVMRCL